jgi:ribosomal protein S18 acetylase RimI-like enzyme
MFVIQSKSFMPRVENNLVFSQIINPNDAQLEAISQLHQKAFYRVLVGQLGERFTRSYYSHLIYSKDGVCFVCTHNDQIIGYVVGTKNVAGLYSQDFKMRAINALLRHIWQKPVLLIQLIRYVQRRWMFPDQQFNAELSAIVVDAAYHRQGVATELIRMFDEWMKSQHVHTYKIFTIMNYEEVYRLYDTLKARVVKDANLCGFRSRLYVRDIV